MCFSILLVFLLFFCYLCEVNASMAIDDVNDKNNVIAFLFKYGYIDGTYLNTSSSISYVNIDDETYSNALLNFQENYGLMNDGLLNKETYELIMSPRCGVVDIGEMNKVERRWPPGATIKFSLHFNNKYSNVARPLVKRAFSVWETVTNLKFVYNRTQPNILLSFGRKQHMYQNMYEKNKTCHSAFDGRGQVLAHAFPPPEQHYYNTKSVKEIHIDEDEQWWFGSFETTPSTHVNFYAVILHEIGHSLGLEHSTYNDSIMFPFYGQNTKLDHIDLMEIEKLYGKKNSTITNPTTSTTTTTPKSAIDVTSPTTATPKSTTTVTTSSTTEESQENEISPPSFCAIANDVKFFFIHKKRLYAIYKKWIWGKDLSADEFEHPQLLSNWIPNIAGKEIIGAYEKPNGEVIIYTSNRVYTLDTQMMKIIDESYHHPQLLNRNLVAISATYTGQILMFTNTTFYYSITLANEISRSTTLKLLFKTQISGGFPSNLNSAFRYTNGIIYLMDKYNMYEYNEFQNIIVRSYRKDFSQIGIRCIDSTLLEQLQKLINKILY